MHRVSSLATLVLIAAVASCAPAHSGERNSSELDRLRHQERFAPTLFYTGIQDPAERSFATDAVNRGIDALASTAPSTPPEKTVEAVAWCVNLMETEDREAAYRDIKKAWGLTGRMDSLPWRVPSELGPSPEPMGHCTTPLLP
jgi:hypothetical protein